MVLVIGSLGVGLGSDVVVVHRLRRAVLPAWQRSREAPGCCTQQKEALERDVLEAQSAPALAEAARNLGMIPTRDTAHLVQDPAGNWVVVGTPKPAEGVPPPPLNTKLPEAGPSPPAAGVPPEVPVGWSPPGGAPAPARLGPEAMLRAPDGASTLGGQHLPHPPSCRAPPDGPCRAVPAVAPLRGCRRRLARHRPAGPAEVRIPLGGLPAARRPRRYPRRRRSASGRARPRYGPAPRPAAPQPAAPVTGEQFGPVTAATPGAPR